MSSIQRCEQAVELTKLMKGELDEGSVAQMESHLSDCFHCRQALEEQMKQSEWWQEAHHALETLDVDLEDSPYAVALSMLGPTDDPSRLGRIANYEIVGILGHGGMGIVFKGFDPSLHRYVAIKVLLPHLAISGAARRRFAREAQAAAAVVDDHVMAIHGVAEWRGLPFLVMPYTKGVSLQKRLTDRGPLELREILRIGSQAAKGLAAAHAQGLVHRDVKPANILLHEGLERVTLTDFGLARAVDDASLTRTGTLTGTPQYMSPEQSRAKPIDARSDLFSLGSVLYALCTGHPPFRADSSYAILRMITDEEPFPIQESNPDIPIWLCKIINKLMEKSPDNRYATAAEVAELLEACLAHVQQPSVVPLPDLFPKSHSPKPVRAAIGITLLASLGGLAAILAFALGRWGEADRTIHHRSVASNPLHDDVSASSAATPSDKPDRSNAKRSGSKRRQSVNAPPELQSERLRGRLLQTIEIKVQALPLSTIIEQLVGQVDVQVDFHRASIQDQGCELDQPCTFAGQGTVRELLRRVLAPYHLTYIVYDNHIEVASMDYASLHPSLRIYDLTVLAESADSTEQRLDLLQRLLGSTASWRGQQIGETLVVSATEQVHRDLETILYSLNFNQP